MSTMDSFYRFYKGRQVTRCVMAIVALFSTFTYRRTNSTVPGAAIATLFVTWYVVAGTATMIA